MKISGEFCVRKVVISVFNLGKTLRFDRITLFLYGQQFLMKHASLLGLVVLELF